MNVYNIVSLHQFYHIRVWYSFYYLIIEKVKTDGPRVIDFFFVNVRFNVIYFAYIIWIYINLAKRGERV